MFRGIDVQYEIWAVKQGNGDWKRCDAKQTETSQTITKSESTQASQGKPVSLGIDERYEANGSTDLADTVVDYSIQLTKIANTTDTKNHSCSESSSDEDEITVSVTLTKDDPAAYAGIRIDQSIIRSLFNKPYIPPQSFTFPNTNGRHCSRTCFFRILPDQTKQLRKWLSYSISADKLYCLHCMLFGGPVASDSMVWVKQGYNNWSKLARDIPHHEESSVHKTAESNRLAWLHGNI